MVELGLAVMSSERFLHSALTKNGNEPLPSLEDRPSHGLYKPITAENAPDAAKG